MFATEKAAQDWVTEQRSQWSTAAWTPKSTRTFDEVADHWLTLRAADLSIGPNTVRADRESLAYARRAFGAVPVHKLTPAALADWSAKPTGKDGKVLAPATKRRAIVRVKSVMVHARKKRWLTYHPRLILTRPNRGRSPRPRPTTYGHPRRWPSSSITSPRTASAGTSR